MDLLIELYSEDIPARLQELGANKLVGFIKQRLILEGLSFKSVDIKRYYSTRRISVILSNIPDTTPNQTKTKRGPRLDLPKEHLQAFSKRSNIDLLNCPTIIHKNVKYYSIEINEGGQNLTELIPDWLQAIIKNFSWPKQMRFADQIIPWVRPLRHVFVMADNKVVSGNINMSSKDKIVVPFLQTTIGHYRFNKENIKISHAVNYVKELYREGVMVDPEIRLKTVLKVIDLEKNKHLNENRIKESASLAEWPVPVILPMPIEYNTLELDLLSEVLWQQQKILVLKNEDSYDYLFVIDRPIKQGIENIKDSLDRVVRARLDDALELLNEDSLNFAEIINNNENKIYEENRSLNKWLKVNNYNLDYIPRLLKIIEYTSTIFRDKAIIKPNNKDKLSYSYKQNELYICEKICLLRLIFSRSAMVEEYPQLELQLIQILYKKRLQQDSLFSEVLDILKTVKSKIITAHLDDESKHKRTVATLLFSENIEAVLRLVFLYGVPSGSNDPYALRARCQVIIIYLQNSSLKTRFNFKELLITCAEGLEYKLKVDKLDTINLLYLYMINRLESHFNYVPVDLLNAVKKSCYENMADILLIVPILNDLRNNYPRGFYALSQLSRRIRNIIAKATNINSKIDEKYLIEADEKALYKSLTDINADSDISQFNQNRKPRFETVLQKIINLSPVLEKFFDTVMVNVDDEKIRNNRLALLKNLHSTIEQFVDFSAMVNLKNNFL